MVRVVTVGHSTHPMATFVDLLRGARVELVLDVRSQPYSRRAPWFTKQLFQAGIEEAGLRYLWLGEALGGRPADDSMRHEDGRPNYGAMRATPRFAAAVGRVVELAAELPVAIACAEEDPTECHRRLLVAPALVERGLEVVHLRGDGRLEDEEAFAGPEQPSLFS